MAVEYMHLLSASGARAGVLMDMLAELFTVADAVLVAVLLFLTVVEVRTRSIPNVLVLGAIVLWLAGTAFAGDWLWSLGGAGLAFICAVVFWQKGWIGGGVAKAALPIGGLLGLVGAAVVVAMAVIGSFVVLRREPYSSRPFMPYAALFCLLFMAARVGFAAFGGSGS